MTALEQLCDLLPTLRDSSASIDARDHAAAQLLPWEQWVGSEPRPWLKAALRDYDQ